MKIRFLGIDEVIAIHREQVERYVKRPRIREERRDVLEQDTRLRKIGDVPEVSAEIPERVLRRQIIVVEHDA